MSEMINAKEFALSVVSGNPVKGDNPEEISKNALDLYFSAMAVVKNNNESIKPEKKDHKKSYEAVKKLGF